MKKLIELLNAICSEDSDATKSLRRELLRIVHPDKVGISDEYDQKMVLSSLSQIFDQAGNLSPDAEGILERLIATLEGIVDGENEDFVPANEEEAKAFAEAL